MCLPLCCAPLIKGVLKVLSLFLYDTLLLGFASLFHTWSGRAGRQGEGVRLRAAPDLSGEEYAGRATSTRAAFGDSNGWCVAVVLSPHACKLLCL